MRSDMTCTGCLQPAHRCMCNRLVGLVRDKLEPTARERARSVLFGALDTELLQLVAGRSAVPTLYTALCQAHTLLTSQAPNSHALTAVAAALVAEDTGGDLAIPMRRAFQRVAALMAVELLTAELAAAQHPSRDLLLLNDIAFDLEAVRALAALLRTAIVDEQRKAIAAATPKGDPS